VVFLRHYATLKPYGLTAGEALFVLQLMSFKWTSEAPFPSYKTLAKRMGITDKMARRYAAALEGKGYLKRTARIGNSNSFDLQALFDALSSALNDQKLKPAA
jgi:DNA-binding MarR family transcriptional regulator